MRLSFALPLILSLALAPSSFAAQKQSAKEPDKPLERIYLETEVKIDEVYQFASDKNGFPVSGTIQSFYPNGRLAWETQWVNGKLHGITRGYYQNRKMREETTWVNGKLNGPAKWYDEQGTMRRETMYENDKDLAAPDNAQEKDTAAGQNDANDTSDNQDKAPEEVENSKDKATEKQ